MKIILLGCGYLGYNLASLPSQKAETENHRVTQSLYAVFNLKKSTPFRLKSPNRVDFEDAVVIDTISLLANNARSEDEGKRFRGVEEMRISVMSAEAARRQLFIFMSSGARSATARTDLRRCTAPSDHHAPRPSKTHCEQVIANRSALSDARLANPYGHQTTDKETRRYSSPDRKKR